MSKLPGIVMSCLLLVPACKGREAESAPEGSIAKALQLPGEKEAEAPPPAAEKPKERKLENPWSFEDVRDQMQPGTKVVYKRTGTDARGKTVDDVLTYLVRSNSDAGAGTSYTVEPDPGSNKASSQVATAPWGRLSPLFAMEKPTETVVEFETVEVPAGTFETVKVELKDFFGNKKAVWMIDEKPGIYAKVIDHGNEGDEKDETELVHELVSVEAGAE